MRAGRLRNKVAIQKVTETVDSFGSFTESWSTYSTVWAEIDPPKGREYFAAGQKQAEITTRIRIRYLSGITPKMRVLFGSRIFKINSIVDPDERHIEQILMCVEEIND